MKSAGVVVLARYGSIVVQFLIVLIISQKLPLDSAGSYFLLAGAILSTYFFAGLGLPDGLVRVVPVMLARGRVRSARSEVSAGVRRAIFTVLPGGALAYLWSMNVLVDYRIAAFTFMWWVGYGVVFIAGQILVAIGFGTLGSALFYGAVSAVQLSFLLPVLIFVVPVDLFIVVAASSVSALLAGLVTAGVCFLKWRLLKYRDSTDLSVSPDENAKAHYSTWKLGIPIAISRVVQSLFVWSPVLVAGLFIGTDVAGELGLASRIVAAVGGLIAAVRFSVRGKYAAQMEVGDWQSVLSSATRISSVSTVLALASLILAALLGPALMPRVFGDSFAGVTVFVLILLIGTIGESIGGTVDEVLKMSGRAALVLGLQSFMLTVSIAGMVVVAMLGPEVIALVYSVGFLLLYASMIFAVWRIHGILIYPRWRP